MANNLSLTLKIDIVPFSEALKSALTMGQRFTEQINGVLSGKITADTSVFDSELKNLNKKIAAFENKEIENDIVLEDKASSVIDQVTKKAKESFESQKSSFAKIRDNFSQIGFAIQGVESVYRVLNGTVGDLIRLAGVQEQAERKVEQAVRQTGMAAGFTVDELKIMASRMQELTTFGDEDILNNVTAQFLTFTNIAGEQFEMAQMQALNLATVLDGDLKSASIQLGKALNDPITNLSALSRSGVQFTEEQKEMVKELWNAGQQAEAQSIILKELNRQYGGQAEAMAGTYSGALKQFNNSWGDLKETLGISLLPIISELAGWLKTAVEYVNGFLRSLSETSLERSIRELREYGAAAKDIAELEKFAMQQRLIEINKELEKTGLEYDKIESVTARIKEINKEQLQLVKDKTILEKNSRYTNEELERIWHNLGYSAQEANQKIKEYNQSLNAGNYTTANGLVLSAIKKRQKELEKETEQILEQKDLLIEREKLEKKIGQEMPEGNEPPRPEGFRDTPPQEGNLESRQDDGDPGEDAKIVAFNKDMAILEAKRQRNADVSKDILDLWDGHLDYLKGAYGEESVEYQQAMTSKYQFERDLDLKKAEDKRKELAEAKAIEDAKWEYEQRQLSNPLSESYDPHQARLNRQIKATEDYFAKNFKLLKKGGMTEEEIIEAKNKAIENLEKASMARKIASQAQGLGDLANTMKSFGKAGFELSKALNIAQVVMETPAAAMSAYKAVVGISGVGPILAPIAYAATIAQGALTVRDIAKAKPPKAEKGGLLSGPSHSEGGILIEAEGDEYITNKKRVRELGKGFFDFINFAPLGTVKEALSKIRIPSVSSIPMPSPILATGGSISNQNSIIPAIEEKMNELIQTVKNQTNQFNFIIKNGSRVEAYKEFLENKKAYEMRMN